MTFTTTTAPAQLPRWLQVMAAGLIERVNDRGMTLTVAGAEAVLRDRISAIAATLHITERSARAYLDRDTLDGMVDGLLDTFSAEAPGSNLLELPGPRSCLCPATAVSSRPSASASRSMRVTWLWTRTSVAIGFTRSRS